MKMKLTLFLLLFILAMPINALKIEHYRGPYPIDFSQNCEVQFFHPSAEYDYYTDDDVRIYNGNFKYIFEKNKPQYVLTGQFKNNIPVGLWKGKAGVSMYLINDRDFFLNFKCSFDENGLPHGEATGEVYSKISNGVIPVLKVILNYKDGELDGVYEAHYADKGLKECLDWDETGAFTKGEKSGVWKLKYVSGDYYKQDFDSSEKAYYFDGQTGDKKELFFDGWKINKRISGYPQRVIDAIMELRPRPKKEDKIDDGKNSEVSENSKLKEQAVASKVIKEENSDDNDPVYNMSMVDQQPQFPGGTSEMYKWLGNNIKYPEEAKKEGVRGKVIVDFVITKTGKTDKVRVVRGRHPALDEEAVRVIKAMPAWTPGKQNGQPVNVSYTLPITFRQQ